MSEVSMASLRAALEQRLRDTTRPSNSKAARTFLRRALAREAPHSDLYSRLVRCCTRDRANNRWTCNRSACPVCARRAGGRYYRQVMQPVFGATKLSRLRFITILHLVADDLDEGATLMRRREDRALRRIFDSTVGSNIAQWRGVREVDVIRPCAWSRYSVGKRALFTSMGFSPERGQPGYLFHSHSLVDLGWMDADDLADRLRKRWPGAHRVRLDAMLPERPLNSSLLKLSRYMHKARYSVQIDGEVEWMTNEEMVTVALFADRCGRGWQGRRFRI